MLFDELLYYTEPNNKKYGVSMRWGKKLFVEKLESLTVNGAFIVFLKIFSAPKRKKAHFCA